MASANQMKVTFISQKLKFLKDRGDNLISDIGLYVNSIVTAGESWIKGEDNKLEYIELCHMIDKAVEFLCEKCEELAGGSMAVAANNLSRRSCEQPGLTSQAITATASTSATSNIQPAVSVQPAELKSSKTSCGFSAQTCFSEVAAGNTITEYIIRHSTVGNNFDADSGIFTAPVDGLYVASLSIYLWEKGNLQVGVRYLEELTSSGTGCGFSAQRWLLCGEVIENHIKQYKINYSTVGNSFNADSGTFTAPADGLYVASISLCLLENELLHVGVRYQQGLGQMCTYVCESSAVMRGTTACGVGVVGMYSGDKLFSCVIETDKNECDKMIYFSCFLLR